ncbi:MAG: Chromate resistance protein ChrB, partial [Thermomicrobiales bacterium]
ALPERPETVVTVGAIAGRIVEFGGQATVVEGARLKLERAVAIVAEARAARATEYADLSREAEAFLAHVERERTHRDFGLTELADLETDLGKLKRWAEQIRARDHFATASDRLLDDCFARCDTALAALLDDASGRGTEERP